jgi:hypothetical protein
MDLHLLPVANTLSALAKLAAAAAPVSSLGWSGLAEAVDRTAPDTNPHNFANSLNVLSMNEAAAAAVSLLGWAGLAEAVGRTASEMTPQGVVNTSDALGFCYGQQFISISFTVCPPLSC